MCKSVNLSFQKTPWDSCLKRGNKEIDSAGFISLSSLIQSLKDSLEPQWPATICMMFRFLLCRMWVLRSKKLPLSFQRKARETMQGLTPCKGFTHLQRYGNENNNAVDTPPGWRCQECGMANKKRGWPWEESPQKRCPVGCKQQSHGAGLLEHSGIHTLPPGPGIWSQRT